MMQETVGTLTLKITRLQQQLQVLQRQQHLGKAYPEIEAKLAHRQLMVEHQLRELMQNKEELQNHVTQYFSKGAFNGELDGQESVCTVN